MKNIFNSFLTVWTYSLTKKEKEGALLKDLGKSETGLSEFFKSVEIFSKTRKYSYK